MKPSKAQFNTIDEYIDSFPEALRAMLQTLRQAIKEAAPEAQETIKYRMPTFTYHGNLVHFAAFKDHIGFYPATSAMDESIEGLSTYRTGKGTLQFPFDQPLPLPLIRRIVEVRVQENLARKQKNKTLAKTQSAPRTTKERR
jgi:uncharacterized protein YdhG (YjbR/CyaY superfamily)